MKFGIFAVAAFWFVKLSAATAPVAGKVDLKELKFVLWGVHKETGSAAATGCPLGTLPDGVFLHKTVKHNDHFFTWVKPVHGLVNELVCGSNAVWKGLDHELLLDFHFFGKAKEGVNFVHLEHLTALGGVAHAFLKFDASKARVAVGLAAFVHDVLALMGGKPFLDVKGLPAHELLHHLALHAA